MDQHFKMLLIWNLRFSNIRFRSRYKISRFNDNRMRTISGVGGAQILQKVTNKDQLGSFTPSSAVVLQIAFAFGLGE